MAAYLSNKRLVGYLNVGQAQVMTGISNLGFDAEAG